MSWDDFEQHQQQQNLPKRRKLFDEVNSKDREVISSFDSDSDTVSPCKIGRLRKPTLAKKPDQQCISPAQIDSFESDSSTNDCFSPKQRNCATVSTIEFPLVQMNGEPKFDSSFIEGELEENCKENKSSTITPRKTVTSWLSNLSTPESSKTTRLCDKSAKKLSSQKHLPGSLAQKAQSLARYRKGEYLLWLHKNIQTPKPPPFNESCIFARITEDEVEREGNVVCVKGHLLDSSRCSVIVVMPMSQQCGEIVRGKVIVVFPEFVCFIKNATHYVVSNFHAQCFDETSYDFSKVSKYDHFQGIEEPQSGTPMISQVTISEYCAPLAAVSVGCHPLSLYVCVYHITTGTGSSHTQLLCCDAADNILIIEVSKELAVREWDKLGMSHSMTLHFTSLQLAHRAPLSSCLGWFPALALFTASSNTLLHCFTAEQGAVAMTGDIEYRCRGDRGDVVCVYLGTVNIDTKRAVSYIVSSLGTLQWVESPPNAIIFDKGTCVKFSGLTCLSTKSYLHDSLSLVMPCITDSTANLTYPNLLSYQDDPSLSSIPRPPLPSFNQYLPLLSPCRVSLTISHVTYRDRVFCVEGLCCGVWLTVTTLPATLRTLLGATRIVSEELPRLNGMVLRCTGIVRDRRSVTQYNNMSFFN